jgi:uncharacterized membrane protein YcfT
MPSATLSSAATSVAAAPARAAVSRVGWVDYAKGWCIILVVMMHSALGVGLAVGEIGWLHQIVAFAKPFRMPDFFLIAGLFLNRVIDKPWRDYIDRKVIHFFYLYALWLFIAYVFKASQLDLTTPLAFAEAYAWGFVQPFSSMWFIHLLPFLFVATRLIRGVPLALTIAAALALHVLAAAYPAGDIYTMESGLTGWVTLDGFAMYFVFFLLGFAFRDKVFALARLTQEYPLGALAILLTWAIGEEAAVKAGLTEIPGLTFVFGLAGACAVVVFASLLARTRWLPWLAYAGRNSLVIYLSFFLPMAITRVALVKSGLIENVGWLSLIVTAVAITTPLMLDAATRNTWLAFLFKRPAWAHLRRA